MVGSEPALRVQNVSDTGGPDDGLPAEAGLAGGLARRAGLQTIRELVEVGGVTRAVDRTAALDEVPEAMRDLERGRVRGKAVVTPCGLRRPAPGCTRGGDADPRAVRLSA